MNHKILTISLGLLGAMNGTPSMAQFYPQYGGGYERDYDRRPRYEERRYEERGYGYDRPRRDLGGVCVTSRGSCGMPQANYIGAPCRCNIPGFGSKRGNVQR